MAYPEDTPNSSHVVKLLHVSYTERDMIFVHEGLTTAPHYCHTLFSTTKWRTYQAMWGGGLRRFDRMGLSAWAGSCSDSRSSHCSQQQKIQGQAKLTTL